MTFLCYESLIRSLPFIIRNATYTSFERPNIPFKMQLFLSNNNITKYCYSLFVGALRKKCDVTDTSIKQKWNRDIGYRTIPDISPDSLNRFFVGVGPRVAGEVRDMGEVPHLPCRLPRVGTCAPPCRP